MPDGVWSCWYLALKVKFEANAVKFCGFSNPRRKGWRHELEFKFDRAEFTGELAEIASVINSKIS